MEKAVLYWRKRLSVSDDIDNVDNDVPGEVSTTHPRWTNQMSNIPRIPQKERVYKGKSGKYGFKLLMRLEQRSTAWIKDIVQKFTDPGSLVVDDCAGTFSVTKASIILRKHRRFIECKSDSSCVT